MPFSLSVLPLVGMAEPACLRAETTACLFVVFRAMQGTHAYVVFRNKMDVCGCV